MRARPVDPGVQALLDEANMLPECAARDALLQRAAAAAEALDDLDTAWSCRCRILSSSTSHEDPRFETLFLCLAWCLAVSDREPQRFSATTVLWQYKWVATAAPQYARVPRRVLERIIDDMEERFVRAGWGRRAGLHKRMELYAAIGEPDRAKELVPLWRATPRDRGADCNACECSSMSSFLADELGEFEQAVREARPVIAGRLTCATVPHSTFGDLLYPLSRLGRHREARDLYERGRRLVAAMEERGAMLSSPYMLYASFIGDTDQARIMLRSRLTQAAALRSDNDRLLWFGRAALTLEYMARRGVHALDLPLVPGLIDDPSVDAASLAARCRRIAADHAAALDARNGNRARSNWLSGLADRWGSPPNEDLTGNRR